MFRHPFGKKPNDEDAKTAPGTVKPVPPADCAGKEDISPACLKDLIEKNLKWSQIIYEQNRKMNNKLLWSAIADWLRLVIILVPIVLALLFLPPILSSLWTQYQNMIGGSTNGPNNYSLDQIFKSLNIDSAKQVQIKALLK